MRFLCPPRRGQFDVAGQQARRSVLFVLSLLTLLAFAAPVQATTVMRLNDYQLVKQSDLIVRGTVESTKSIWVLNKSTIVTLVKIRVQEEVLKRKVGSHITVRIFGGKIGNMVANIPGNVSFLKGNEVIVVVSRSKYLPKGEFLLVGLTQGKWVIARPKSPVATLAPMAFRSLGDVKLYPRINKDHAHVAPKVSQYSLQNLLKRFRTEYAKLKAKQKLPLAPTVRPAVKLPSHLVKPKVDAAKLKPAPVRTVPSKRTNPGIK